MEVREIYKHSPNFQILNCYLLKRLKQNILIAEAIMPNFYL